MFLSGVAPAFAQADVLHVRHPRAESARDARTAYPVAMLRLVLERSDREFLLEPTADVMPQSRSLLRLRRAEGIDVVWTTADARRERDLRRIRYPLDRGLIGWRVLLVGRGQSPRFAAVDSISALARLRGAQGHDWPDLAILRDAGLQVEGVPAYEGLFAMLALGRIDYLPRAVTEVDTEMGRRRSLPIELEPRLLLHYRSALWFYVHPRDDELASALETGFRRSVEDGSFQRLFESEYGPLVKRTREQRRRVLRLSNTQLLAPASDDAGLWLDPEMGP